ncbi:MAG: hypothetical protein SRB2_02948 [Desulfobacteraceae bacterium Eth-SRB2]|nr:MAG: hypothetical protein SRB2_02948 [Desulfobacteraceae bacterium Eth-SRB2]
MKFGWTQIVFTAEIEDDGNKRTTTGVLTDGTNAITMMRRGDDRRKVSELPLEYLITFCPINRRPGTNHTLFDHQHDCDGNHRRIGKTQNLQGR